MHARQSALLAHGAQLQVIAVHTDQTIENVTAQAVWMPADASLFTVTAGRLVGKAPGTADLAVSWGGAITRVPVRPQLHSMMWVPKRSVERRIS